MYKFHIIIHLLFHFVFVQHIAEAEEKLCKEIKADISKFKSRWAKRLEDLQAQANSIKMASTDLEEVSSILLSSHL